MEQVQAQFNNQGNDIGTQLSALFSSISQLSANPASVALRQGVLTAASNLASGITTTANNLQSQQTNLDLSVTQSVDQVNTLTQQIAKVNGQIAALENLHQDASAFVDQRDVLIGQLSNLIDVSQIKTESQISLTTSNGTALVAGTQAFTLTTQPDPSGLEHIFAQGNDITSQLNSGQLGGLLQVRDQKIAALLTSLDTLASGISNSFNSANIAGFDLNGNQGGTSSCRHRHRAREQPRACRQPLRIPFSSPPVPTAAPAVTATWQISRRFTIKLVSTARRRRIFTAA
jgi:flagellar hook-associated protein 1 FlgK